MEYSYSEPYRVAWSPGKSNEHNSENASFLKNVLIYLFEEVPILKYIKNLVDYLDELLVIVQIVDWQEYRHEENV